MADSGADRNSVRSTLFSGAPKFRSEQVEVNGTTVEVRQPSIRVRRELFNECMDSTNGQLDANDFLIKAVLKNTYLPGTNERVFDDEDYDGMMNQPTGGWVDTLIDAMSRLTNAESSGKGESG